MNSKVGGFLQRRLRSFFGVLYGIQPAEYLEDHRAVLADSKMPGLARIQCLLLGSDKEQSAGVDVSLVHDDFVFRF